MAYDTFQFGFNPFERYQRPIYEVPGGDYGDSGGGLVTNIPIPTETAYRFAPQLAEQNPALFANWSNPDNFRFVGTTADGMPQFQIKTGDKEGSLYTLRPDGQGGYAAVPESQSSWDTNNQLQKWGPFLPALAMGGASLASGLAGTGFGGSGIGAAPAAAGGASTAPATSGGFIENLLGQSTASGGSLGAAQTAAPGFLAGAAATAPAPMSLIPFTGASTSALLGGAGLAGTGYEIAQKAADAAAKASSGGSGSTPTVGPSAGGSQPTGGSGGSGGGFQMPTDAAGWLKLLGPLLGGGLLAYDAARQNGQQNPTDAYTRDWARNQLANAPTAPAPGVTEQYRNAMMSGLSSGTNPALSGLMNKRFY